MARAGLNVGDNVVVTVRETQEPLRTRNPCMITKINRDTGDILAVEKDGNTKRCFSEKGFQFKILGR
jgi:hypothetical protein